MPLGDRRFLSDDEVVSVDPASVKLFCQVRRIAACDAPVFVQGETGAGKGLIAWALHQQGPRRDGPFVSIDCSSLPSTARDAGLFERLLDVVTETPGYERLGLELPRFGTLLLDEVGDLSAQGQATLLHILKEREREIESASERRSMARLICTSRRDLSVDVRLGRFRSDLFFRFSALHIAIPPLRDRPGDILPMVQKVLALHGPNLVLSADIGVSLMSYSWPGNFRELINTIKNACALSEDGQLRNIHIERALRQGDTVEPIGSILQDPLPKLRDIERQALIDALERHQGNPVRAARELGLTNRTFFQRISRYRLLSRLARHDR